MNEDDFGPQASTGGACGPRVCGGSPLSRALTRAERVLFGSDMNWIDARANLAPVLAAHISDEVVLQILRTNAMAMYRRRTTK